MHFSLSAEIVRQLAPRLRPRYLVLPAERFVLETPESIAITATDMYPDVGVSKSDSPTHVDDNDAFLDLQAAFTAMYDLLGYDLAVDYSQPPELPLTGEAAAWIDEHLRAAGQRN